MRDLGSDAATTAGASTLSAPSVAEIESFTRRLALDTVGLEDAEMIDRLAALETLRCATEAAQCETVADFVISQRRAAAGRGVPAARRDRGVASQVALAMRQSPTRGQRQVGLAMTLRTELASTRAAFRAGHLDGYKATLIARETACLTAVDRARVDEQLCANPTVVERLSPRRLVGRLQRAAAQLDPAAVVKRRRRAEADRHVSLRPAPETMTTLSALLPLKAGVAVHATLSRAARAAKAGGDPRSIGQLMADILTHRVVHPGLAETTTGTGTGGREAETSWAAATAPAVAAAVPAGTASAVPVMVNLIVRDSVLLGDEDGAGWVDGYGPVPGELIRGWVADNLETGLAAWVRRVYEQPTTGKLVAMDSTAVLFQGRLAEFIRVRDKVCRTPGCDAPIRHTDHVEARARGGPTTEDNGQGLCELCNHAKQADGWTARTVPGPTHTVETTTPTGHTYTSTAEPL
ncbi:MAG TPA: DUF222 domain-containing protein [Nocardioides sp.]|uniref:HNH endonuclease n=1 Tax=Nocardioides sp. TaxID=35761 RepID=UPI002E34E975|nr:DUF222 domain-containing protein [Nocardioides sp.]HEX5087911.1 DUF222 domain-containing protein [Nocardioides sp.]